MPAMRYKARDLETNLLPKNWMNEEAVSYNDALYEFEKLKEAEALTDSREMAVIKAKREREASDALEESYKTKKAEKDSKGEKLSEDELFSMMNDYDIMSGNPEEITKRELDKIKREMLQEEAERKRKQGELVSYPKSSDVYKKKEDGSLELVRPGQFKPDKGSSKVFEPEVLVNDNGERKIVNSAEERLQAKKDGFLFKKSSPDKEDEFSAIRKEIQKAKESSNAEKRNVPVDVPVIGKPKEQVNKKGERRVIYPDGTIKYFDKTGKEIKK